LRRVDIQTFAGKPNHTLTFSELMIPRSNSNTSRAYPLWDIQS